MTRKRSLCFHGLSRKPIRLAVNLAWVVKRATFRSRYPPWRTRGMSAAAYIQIVQRTICRVKTPEYLKAAFT